MEREQNGRGALGALRKLEASRPFTEREAWGLFRIAAIGEAFGWSVLITGIGINRYHLPGHAYSISVAGQIHGTLFLVYFGILLAAYSSLRWPRWKFLLAAAAGVVPYGTLFFEQWAARSRRAKLRQAFFWSNFLAAARRQTT